MTPFNEREDEIISSRVENRYARPQNDPFASLTRLKAIERGPNNLPAQTTPLIGREDELKAATQLLLRDDVRIVTFTGPGGSGKTRLSIETARVLIERFRGGVFFVSLAMLTDPNLVASEIVSTLGVEEKKEVPLIENLKDYLRDKRILLVLDNFEQVISAAPIAAELLSNCPMVKLLITSRSPLRVRGEHEFSVLPLRIPNLKNLPTFEALLDYAAVALFVQRAQNVRLGFSLTSQNARTVAEICARLDGLPLALELAAARIRILSPNEMLRLLEKEKGDELLTSGARDLPVRQRTVHDTIAWSYELLDADEKKLFRRLSVFVGGFSLEAAEAICNRSDDLQGQTLDGLSKLAEKSLLRREEVDGESRFVMLETIREFALELLRASGELHRTLENDTEYFLSLAEKADPQLKGPEQFSWLNRLDHTHDNLRAVLQWSIENKQLDISLRIVCVLWSFWYIRGYLAEGRIWLTRVLADTGSVRNVSRAKALLGAGVLAVWQCDFSLARSLLDESRTLSRELGDEEVTAFTYDYLGAIAEGEGNFEEAYKLLGESLTLFRKLGNKWGIAFVLNGLGVVARDQGDYDKASTFHKQSLELFREIGDKRYIARSLANLGSILDRKGDYDPASKLHRESLSLFRELGERGMIAELLLDLGRATRRQGDYDEAEATLAESLSLSKELGHVDAIAVCLEELAACACMKEQFERTTRLLGAVETLREAKRLPISPAYRSDIQRDLATARSALGRDVFNSEWTRGRALTLEQAIAYALTGEPAD